MQSFNKQHYILYKTINMINNKYYIGIHGTNNIDDGYLGSGRNIQLAIKKYGKENFHREILSFADNYSELAILEREIVTEEFCLNNNNYNIEIGGAGGKIWTTELRKTMSKAKKGSKGWNKGLKGANCWPEESKKAKSLAVSGNKNPMFGKRVADIMTPENNAIRLKKISEANTGKIRTDKHKKNYSISAKGRIWLIHISGKSSHTNDENDPRLFADDWQRGRKWRKSK